MPELDEPTTPQLDDNEAMGAEVPEAGSSPKLNLLNHDDGARSDQDQARFRDEAGAGIAAIPAVSDRSNEVGAADRAAKKGGDSGGGPRTVGLPGGGKSMPEKGGAGGMMAGLGGRIGGLMSGRRRWAILGGGGLLGVILALFFAFSQLKLIGLMETLAKHVFRRNSHMYEVRREKFMNEFMNKYFGEANVNIDDNTATFTQQVMRRMHDGLEPRLNEKYKIETIGSDHPGYKKFRVTNNATGEVTEFDTYGDRREGRRFINQVADDITHDDNWVKRIWYKRRLTDITGTRWHWLDPIKQPYAKAVVIAENQLAKFLLVGSGRAAEVAAGFLDSLLGAEEHARVAAELERASSEEGAKIISKVVVKKALTAVTGVGLVVTAIDVGCGINKAIVDGSIQKAVKQYTELQYMTAFAAEQSKSHQLKEGKTDAPTLAANMSLYTLKDDKGKIHDYTESNNYRRQVGENVAYHPTDNCEDPSELCTQNLPKSRLDNSIFGKVLNTETDLANNQMVKLFAPIGVPGSYSTNTFCTVTVFIIDKAAGAASWIFEHTAAQLIPGYEDFKKVAAKFIGKVSDKMLSELAGPVVDASKKGPLLAHVLGAGGSLAAASAAGSPVGQTADSNTCTSDPDSDSSMCGHKLSKKDVTEQNTVIAEEDAQDYANSSTWSKIASIDNPRSVASRLIAATPLSFEQATQQSQAAMLAVISPATWSKLLASLPKLFSAPSFAASAEGSYVVLDNGDDSAHDQFGTDYTGFTEAELNQPLETPGLKNIDRNMGCSAVAGLKYTKGPHKGEPIPLPPACERFLSGGESDQGNDSAQLGSGNFVWPVDKIFPVISCWKNNRGNHLHAGIDISAPIGTPVHASADGKVEIANGTQDPEGYGNMIVINHGNGMWTLYGHLNEIGVTVGQTVKQGDVIGKTGNSGHSEGPHLHFNIQNQGGALGNAANPGTLNPLDLLPSDGRALRTGSGICGPGPTGYKQ